MQVGSGGKKNPGFVSKVTGNWENKKGEPPVGSIEQTLNSHRISYLINQDSQEFSYKGGRYTEESSSSSSENDSD